MTKSRQIAVRRPMPVLVGIKRELDRLDNEFVAIGHKLLVVSESREWCDAGYASFKDALEAAGLEVRKAYYLIQIATAMRLANLPEAEAHEIGWTKMATIAPMLGNGRKSDKMWVEYARTCTVEVLKQVVKGRKPANAITFTFLMLPAQRRVVEKVLTHVNGGKMPRGLEARGRTLASILAEYAKIRRVGKAKQAA